MKYNYQKSADLNKTRSQWLFFIVIITCILFFSGCKADNSPHLSGEDGSFEMITPDYDLSEPAIETAGASAATSTDNNTSQSNNVYNTAAVIFENELSTQTPVNLKDKCDQKQGKIEIHEIESQKLKNPLKFRVYLPPCYNANIETGYPILILLHGQGYNDDQWDRLGADEIADDLINSGCHPFIMVMPWEEFNLVDPWQSGFDNAIIDELLPWLDENLATCRKRECRAIGGISRGGAWSIRIGLMHWEYFGSIAAHSFPPFKNDIYLLPDWLRVFPSNQRPRIYVDIGTYDRYQKAANEFQMAFVTYRLPYEWHFFEGMHDEAYWSAHVGDYLEWYVKPWNDQPYSVDEEQ